MADDSKEPDADEQFSALLEGLRATLPGVEVLFGFLLVLPFQQGFAKLDDVEKKLYAVALTSAGIALILLIAPSVHQRVRAPFSGLPRHSREPREDRRVPRDRRERRRLHRARSRPHGSRSPSSTAMASPSPWASLSPCCSRGHGSGSRWSTSTRTAREAALLARRRILSCGVARMAGGRACPRSRPSPHATRGPSAGPGTPTGRGGCSTPATPGCTGPREYGGRGASPTEQLIFYEETARANARPTSASTSSARCTRVRR